MIKSFLTEARRGGGSAGDRRELARLKLDVIITGYAGVYGRQTGNGTVPIVFAGVAAVGSGRPARNCRRSDRMTGQHHGGD
jgi:hypothetical protein